MKKNKNKNRLKSKKNKLKSKNKSNKSKKQSNRSNHKSNSKSKSKWTKLILSTINDLNLEIRNKQNKIEWKNLGDNYIQIYLQKESPILEINDNYTKSKTRLYSNLYFKTNSVVFGGIYGSFFINDFNQSKICYNKFLCSQKLREANIPAPISIIYSPDKHYNHITRRNELNQLGIDYPLVVKSIKGTGGYAVQIVPKLEFRKSSDLVFRKVIQDLETEYKGVPILIEKFIKGDDYRIVCYHDKIIDIFAKVRPYIIGDGTSTIENLVHLYNEENSRLGFLPKAQIDLNLLKKANYTKKTILPKDTYFVFNTITNYHKGGRLKKIDLDRVHPDNIKMFKKVNQILGMNLTGIDFLSSDISKSWKENNSGINEVNSQPYLGGSYLVTGELDVYKRLLKNIFFCNLI